MKVEIKIGTTCPYCMGTGKLKAMQRAMTFNGSSIRVHDTKVERRHCKGTGRRYDEIAK